MEFTQEQISEIISEITNREEGLQGLVKQGLENLIDSISESVTLAERFNFVNYINISYLVGCNL
ncbi:hypothetical protein [Odoribacter laneus]|uniref:hypothetical protein n=1 Tax=Odoribacter laneus TaxID=626933 RepID=UPI0023F2F4CF|nr:hypothetical protein [Odoribacter laneus]